MQDYGCCLYPWPLLKQWKREEGTNKYIARTQIVFGNTATFVFRVVKTKYSS